MSNNIKGLSVLILLLFTSSVFGNKGGSPNGKPFINLQQQIFELAGYAETLEGQIVNINTVIANIEGTIEMLSNAIANGTGGNITLLEQDLQEAQAQLANLNAAVSALEEQIALKQALVNGTCPNGSAVRQVFPDGSVACQSTPTGSASTLTTFYVIGSTLIQPGGAVGWSVNCPAGSHVTGGGFSGWPFIETLVSRQNNSNGWATTSRNTDAFTARTAYNYATCIELN